MSNLCWKKRFSNLLFFLLQEYTNVDSLLCSMKKVVEWLCGCGLWTVTRGLICCVVKSLLVVWLLYLLCGHWQLCCVACGCCIYHVVGVVPWMWLWWWYVKWLCVWVSEVGQRRAGLQHLPSLHNSPSRLLLLLLCRVITVTITQLCSPK